ncbi:peritrophin-44 isoform X3 [Drosophila teissieri]|uniref:peritrophin-44 isoform X3 n=1 Tax=Drosophila teissieri TaxID=7243 RepID=UPI001CBA0210|nr:peritrophin-44 isoform X3 [Drosophila teissieri]
MEAFNVRICVVAACLFLASQAIGYTMDDLCKQWSGAGYIGNPSDCRGWGYCLNQQTVSWGTCKTGLVFNAQTACCENATITPCSTSAVQTCSAISSPIYVPNLLNCTEYAHCDGKGKIAYGDCGNGGVYSEATGKCQWGPACPQDNICRFMQSNIFVGDPNKCGSYMNCINGYGSSTACTSSPNIYYNAATGKCQSTNPCTGDNTNSGDSGQFTVGQTSNTACNATNFKNAQTLTVDDKEVTYKYVTDSETCYGYYYCADEGATGYWNQCPTGTQFNNALGKCVSPASFVCTHNRCGNVNNKFMAVEGCLGYTICSSGATNDCPSTSKYYDEVNNICTSTEPKYAICKSS